MSNLIMNLKILGLHCEYVINMIMIFVKNNIGKIVSLTDPISSPHSKKADLWSTYEIQRLKLQLIIKFGYKTDL